MYKITLAEMGDICNHAELDENGIRSDYSGRGMMGASCLGLTISGDAAGLLQLGAAIHTSIIDAEDADQDTDALYALLYGAKTDSMGHDTIVYWPHVELGGIED